MEHFLCLFHYFTSSLSSPTLGAAWADGLFSWRGQAPAQTLLVSAMAKTPSDHLLNTLEELVPYDFEKFKFKLQNTSLEKEHSRIPRGQLQMARPVRLATLLVTHYGEEHAVRLTLQVLRAINQRLLAEELHRATEQECPAAGRAPGSPKAAEGPEGEGQRQSGDGAASSPSGQPEAGRGPQKKPQVKRREPKCLGVDAQGRPGARRSPVLGRPPGDRPGPTSARLRRNASSAGRLQGQCGAYPGKTEQKKLEVYLPSGKKRPKSLELISSRDREPPNPGTLLPQEEAGTRKPASAATPRGAATHDAEAAQALEKSSRNPDHSLAPGGRTVRNTLANAAPTGGGKPTAPCGKKGTGDPETPAAAGEAAEGAPQEAADPDLLPSAGRPQDKAACPLCHTQEGDPVGTTCRRDSCSCPVAPAHPRASGGRLPGCPHCQVSLAWKSSRGLSPPPLPHCQRHMKQLLFCEDHGEPTCLICSLSQEHRGHRVRPIEEVALEYRIQKQLEHLKQLRRCGEERRSQGDEKMEKFLKQTETQRQRVCCQLEQLFQFLEEQEQLFVAWLEELGQTIGQVREKYGTRVSWNIALLDELIGELEAKQCKSEWELMQDIGVTLHSLIFRAKAVTVPEPWATPPEVKEKIQLLYQKSEFIEKSMESFSETLRSEMETFNVPELISAQAHAVNVTLDAETSHPNLIFSDDLKSMRLGNKWERLPEEPERFDSCIIALGSPSFLSGRHYWEVEVGDKTAWILGVCKASMSRKGSMILSPENGYWVVMMKQNEYRVSTFPPTRLWMRELPRRVGIFLDYKTRNISFYNVTARSHMYTFTSFSSSGPLQPIFSPGAHDRGKNMGPLTICPVGDQRLR
nr:pyrin isoform X4 [Oryctolagus cuniculus]